MECPAEVKLSIQAGGRQFTIAAEGDRMITPTQLQDLARALTAPQPEENPVLAAATAAAAGLRILLRTDQLLPPSIGKAYEACLHLAIAARARP